MAYMNQEKKKALSPKIKAVLKKYRCTGSLRIRNHSTLCLSIREGRVDPFKDSVSVTDHMKRYGTISVNTHWIQDHYTGPTRDMIRELILAMNEGNHDRSDASADYFDVGWYIDINFGDWKKPYKLLT